ncbi:MAG: hypothetical protein IPJ39_22775 [Saprospiraceae bacterium]|nr:hypothetical protein [Saprospiraceae bacterium]
MPERNGSDELEVTQYAGPLKRIKTVWMECERWMLPDAIQRELRKWDSRGHMTAHVYDALNRPSSNSVYDANGFITYEKYVHGEILAQS